MAHYLIWLLTAILYSPVFYQLYRSRWQAIDYTHAYFILPVSLWLVWLKRNHIKELTAAQSGATAAFFGPALILSGILMFIFGWRQEYLFISTLSLIPLLFGLLLYLSGVNIAKALSFPILYLFLLVPPPLGILDSITLPMRYGISVACASILKAFSYPIIRDGLLLSIGGKEIYMGAPCSGFRSLITMISLGLVYVYLSKAALKQKAVLIGSIVPFALLGNLIRVIGVCLATFYLGHEAGEKFHDISGFVIFMILILGLFGLESFLQRRKR